MRGLEGEREKKNDVLIISRIKENGRKEVF